jgi:formylglycine-generating enzyme required for sulfatase activity
VREWVADEYRSDAYARAAGLAVDVPPFQSGERVVRGAGFKAQYFSQLHPRNRGIAFATDRLTDLGFRCASTPR